MTKKTSQETHKVYDDKKVSRREALQHLGKLAYIAPTLTVIPLNAFADEGPNPPPPLPGSGSPLQQLHPAQRRK